MEELLKILEDACAAYYSTVIHVPDQLAADEEFRAYIEENVDLEWETKGVPQKKIPQWIKDWIK